MVPSFSFDGQKLVLAAVVAATTAFGCMVDDSTDAPAATAGAGGTGGSAGAGGSPPAGCTPNPAPLSCAGALAPAWGVPPGTLGGLMIDFGTYLSDGKWGASASGELTGGTSFYQGPTDVSPTAMVDGDSLRIMSSITAMGYTGVVFWFGPCVDASAFTGISFSVGGSLGGAVLKAQIQTHVDYPVDTANSKGGCTFMNCDNRFTECAGPTTLVAVPEMAAPVALPWASFTAGTPVAEVTPDGLVGMQFQLECQQDVACAADFTLGTINFTIAP